MPAPAGLLSPPTPVGAGCGLILFFWLSKGALTSSPPFWASTPSFSAACWPSGSSYWAPHAFKDTVGGILIVLVFGGSLCGAAPVEPSWPRHSPPHPQQEAPLERLFAERPVARTPLISTAGPALLNAVTAAINFVLNLWIVSAPRHGGVNSQVARVNAVTRLTLGVPESAVIGPYDLVGHLLSVLPALFPADGYLGGEGISGNWLKRQGQGVQRRVVRKHLYSPH